MDLTRSDKKDSDKKKDDKYKKKYHNLLKKQIGGDFVEHNGSKYCTAGVLLITRVGDVDHVILFGEKRGNDTIYSFPAGRCNLGQTLEQNAARKLREETANLYNISPQILTQLETDTNYINLQSFDNYCKGENGEDITGYIRTYCMRLDKFNQTEYINNVQTIIENINNQQSKNPGDTTTWTKTNSCKMIPLKDIQLNNVNQNQASFGYQELKIGNTDPIKISVRALRSIVEIQKNMSKIPEKPTDKTFAKLSATVNEISDQKILAHTKCNIILSQEEGFKYNDLVVVFDPEE